jgi:signal transduction histidine kinase
MSKAELRVYYPNVLSIVGTPVDDGEGGTQRMVVGARVMRRVLWGPWLIIAVAWPATLLGWYYISLAAEPSRLRDEFLLGYLVILLAVDSMLCVVVLSRATVETRAALSAREPLQLARARAAWHEALRLPQRTAWLICGLITLTALPITFHLLWLGERMLVLHGWIAAAIVGICELTVLFPLVQATTLPFLRSLKAAHPELRLIEAGAPRPPQRAYFLASLIATALVAIVLVARLIVLRDVSPADSGMKFPADAAIALTAACLAAMFGGIGLQLHLSVLLPLRALARAMNRFAAGEHIKPLGLPHVGEIGILAEHFDDMVAALTRSRADLDERNAVLRHAQRFDAMGLMAASLVHEMANPLAGIRVNLKVADDMVREAATRADAAPALMQAAGMLKDVRQAAELIGGLLGDLKSFGRRDDDGTETCHIEAVMEMALRIVRTEIDDSIGIERNFQPAPPVAGNSLKLTQVFVNLLLNALAAMRPDVPGVISVGVRAEAGRVDAWVTDNGIGMPAETRAHIFSAMYSRGYVGVGSGLGLYICRQIVEAHGGRIDCTSIEQRGTSFRVSLPLPTVALRRGDAGCGP